MGRMLVVAAVLVTVCPYLRAEGGGPDRLASVTIGGGKTAPQDKPAESPATADTPGTTTGTYDLRTRYKVGQVIVVRSSVTTDMHLKGEMPMPDLADMPPDLVKELKKMQDEMARGMHTEEKAEVRYTVDEVRDGLPAVARAEVKSVEETMPGGPGDAAGAPPNELAGKTIVVTTDADGKCTYATESGREVDPKEASHYCNDLADNLLRGKHVSAATPGQEWEVADVVVRSMFDVGEKGEAKASLKFVDVVVRDGRQLARMELHAHVREDVGDGPGMSLDMTGEYLFDLKRHMPYRVTGEGTVRMGGGGDKEMGDMAMEGPTTVKAVFQDVTGK